MKETSSWLTVVAAAVVLIAVAIDLVIADGRMVAVVCRGLERVGEAVPGPLGSSYRRSLPPLSPLE